jgi:hypothetical protein
MPPPVRTLRLHSCPHGNEEWRNATDLASARCSPARNVVGMPCERNASIARRTHGELGRRPIRQQDKILRLAKHCLDCSPDVRIGVGACLLQAHRVQHLLIPRYETQYFCRSRSLKKPPTAAKSRRLRSTLHWPASNEQNRKISLFGRSSAFGSAVQESH